MKIKKLSIPKKSDFDLVAHSPYMKKLAAELPQIASSSASVFINGESGTGKEVIAQAIHHLSSRKSKPFVKVNCAAIPEPLLESEFFGHEKGAFTGAIKQRMGRFELANEGTLLLDEISEIPLSVQSKLLRAVQEQEFERVGGNHSIKVDVRFVSTSNRKIDEAIEENLFRKDLYYRLNVIPIYLPPLRERKEDILPLASHFLQRFEKGQKILSEQGKKKLLSYAWPGNIRELSNVIERALVISKGEMILPEDLAIEPESSKKAKKFKGLTLKEVEKKHILEILKEHGNNKTKAAKALGISIRTLRNKLAIYLK